MQTEVDRSTMKDVCSAIGGAVEMSELVALPESLEEEIEDDWPRRGLNVKQVAKDNSIGVKVNIPPESDVLSGFESADKAQMGVNWDPIEDTFGAARDDRLFVRLNDDSRRLEFEGDSGFEAQRALVALTSIPAGSYPDIPVDVELETTVSDFRNVVSTCDLVGTSMYLEVKEKDGVWGLYGRAEGDTDKTGDRVMEVSGDDQIEISTLFNIDLLDDALKSLPDSSLTVRMSQSDSRNMPIELHQEFAGGAVVDIMIAPYNPGA